MEHGARGIEQGAKRMGEVLRNRYKDLSASGRPDSIKKQHGTKNARPHDFLHPTSHDFQLQSFSIFFDPFQTITFNS